MAIDVGSEAIERPSILDGGNTVIPTDNPANASGQITSVEIYAYAQMTNCKVGTFYLVSGTTFKCRDSVLLGTIASGSKQTYSGLSLEVQIGDFLGIYWLGDGGRIYRATSGGVGAYWLGGDNADPDDEASYSLLSASIFSLYGTGTEPEASSSSSSRSSSSHSSSSHSSSSSSRSSSSHSSSSRSSSQSSSSHSSSSHSSSSHSSSSRSSSHSSSSHSSSSRSSSSHSSSSHSSLASSSHSSSSKSSSSHSSSHSSSSHSSSSSSDALVTSMPSFPAERDIAYDPDLVFDDVTGTWVNSEELLAGNGSRYRGQLVAIGRSLIYYEEMT